MWDCGFGCQAGAAAVHVVTTEWLALETFYVNEAWSQSKWVEWCGPWEECVLSAGVQLGWIIHP